MVPGESRDYALYLRKSKGYTGIERQRTATTAHLERRGGRVAAEFADEDRTAYRKPGAARPEREDFDAMLTWLAGHPGAGVSAWHLDRLVRDPREAVDLIDVFRDGGHLVETKAGGTYDLETATGRRNFLADAGGATFEVDHLRERVLEQKEEARAAGLWLGSMRPFGYEGITANPDAPRDPARRPRKYDGLRIVPAESAAINAAARDILAGTSLHAIVRQWEAAGIRGTQGGKWTVSNLRRLLTNPRYAGLMTHKGSETGPAVWPPVLREEVFRGVKAVLGPRASPGHSVARRWLGSGLYECATCGQKVRVRGAGGRGKSYCCPDSHAARAVSKVDEYVTEVILSVLERPALAKALAEANPLPRGEDITLLQSAIAEAEECMLGLSDAYADRAISDKQLRSGTARIRKEIAGYEQRIQAAARVSALAGVAGDPGIRDEWPGWPLSRQQAVIRELVTVRIHPAGPGRPAGVPWPQGWFDTSLIEFIPVDGRVWIADAAEGDEGQAR